MQVNQVKFSKDGKLFFRAVSAGVEVSSPLPSCMSILVSGVLDVELVPCALDYGVVMGNDSF